jgi:hypothetical protein
MWTPEHPRWVLVEKKPLKEPRTMMQKNKFRREVIPPLFAVLM